ncbi:hypothetical protein HPB50_028630 [Hyalomma asiaticum]|nr:hypothetical protein HPB50_028630 [Hyalomma asiaticum]
MRLGSGLRNVRRRRGPTAGVARNLTSIPRGWIKPRISRSLGLLNEEAGHQADRQRDFGTLLSAAIRKAGGKALVVAGDFNAPNMEWGHVRSTVKGTGLANRASELGLTLITDPRFPTRRGDSVKRDTTPDLVFLRDVDGEWGNLQEDLGSDHYLLETLIEVRPPPPFRHKYVDWDLFRRIREEEASDDDDFAGLLARLQQAVERATKEIETQLAPPCSADSVAAFPDERLPHAHLGDTFVKREPTCPAKDDPFAFRARPHATVGAEPDLSSVPFAAHFGADARCGEQAREPSPAATYTEQTPLHATAAQLLQVLLEAARSQPCALVGDSQSPQPGVTSSLRVHLPEYSGYSDRMSAMEYLEALHRYQQAMRLDDSVMLASVLPVSLTAQAARWYRLVGFQARSMEEFRTLFRSDFLREL